MKPNIEHLESENRFVTIIEGHTALLSYSRMKDGKVLNYQHTFVPPELRGRHIGQDIVQFALDYARLNGYKVIPTCPFVRKFIMDHPDYKDVTDNE